MNCVKAQKWKTHGSYPIGIQSKVKKSVSKRVPQIQKWKAYWGRRVYEEYQTANI
jgi:hypothetical protein